MLLPPKNLKDLSPEVINVVDRMVVEVPDTKGSVVVKFFEGKSVFITGGSGFLGKVLIEKLLRVCGGLKKVFVLCRNKKDKDVTARMNELFNSALFEKLRALQPNFMEKIMPISGDISLPGLGISADDRKMLIKEVNIVFHVAATVNFNEKLKDAAAINVYATIEMLKMARECVGLKSYVHVSTAYSKCMAENPSESIVEKFYEPPMKSDEFLQLVASKSDEELIELTPSLLGKFANTYTFTKNIAEAAVKQYSEGLPVTITRPGIVVSTYEEPMRGFVDNPNGPSGLLTAAGLGIARVVRLKGEYKANYVPVDYAINNTIVAAYKTYSKKSAEIPIYNYVCDSSLAITYKEFMDNLTNYGRLTPTALAIWYPFLLATNCSYGYKLMSFFLNYLPALLLDFINGYTHFTGKSNIEFVRIYNKLESMITLLLPFTTQVWIWENDNVQALWNELSDVDKRLFPFDMNVVDWEFFTKLYSMGIRTYFLQDDVSTVPEARKRLFIFYVLHCLLVGFVALTSFWSIYKVYELFV